MVTRSYLDDEQPPFRRHSTRGHGYPLSSDRDSPAISSHGAQDRSRNYQLSSHDAPSSEHGSEQDSTSHPRRRIPVACGRCRKRKIRCSGDPGNGGPCSNCKSAGNEQCQFLRVSSTEAQMKSDGGDFGFDTAAARQVQCRMVAYGSGPQPYMPQVNPLGPEAFPYRNNSLSAYQYPVKTFYGVSPYGEYADENVDYGLQNSSYPILGPDPVSISSHYGPPSAVRGWIPAPQVSKNSVGSLFLDQESTYSQGQLSYHSNGYMIRPTISPESKSFSINGMATSLSTQINGNDRVLPFPSANRPAPVGPLLRSTDNIHHGSQSGLQCYSGLIGTNMLSAVKAVSNNSITETGPMQTSYLQLSTSNVESTPQSQITYGSHDLPVNQQHNDLYATNDSFFHHGNSCSDSSYSYGPSGEGSKRGSQSSQTHNDGLGISQSNGNLANGHSYIPSNSHSTYPTPPMDMQPAAPRRSVGSLQPV